MADETQSAYKKPRLRERWALAKSTRNDFVLVGSDINAAKLVCEASIFERGSHVPITHSGYIKPRTDAFLVELLSKDRRSAKERDYVNGAGVWIATGLSALALCKESKMETEEIARKLALAISSLKAALEVLQGSAPLFCDITKHGVSEAQQIGLFS